MACSFRSAALQLNKTSSSYGICACVSDSDAAHLTGRVHCNMPTLPYLPLAHRIISNSKSLFFIYKIKNTNIFGMAILCFKLPLFMSKDKVYNTNDNGNPIQIENRRNRKTKYVGVSEGRMIELSNTKSSCTHQGREVVVAVFILPNRAW